MKNNQLLFLSSKERKHKETAKNMYKSICVELAFDFTYDQCNVLWKHIHFTCPAKLVIIIFVKKGLTVVLLYRYYFVIVEL